MAKDAFGVDREVVSKMSERDKKSSGSAAAGAAGGAAAGAVGATAKEGVKGIREAQAAVKAAKDLENPANYIKTGPTGGGIHAWYGGTTRAQKAKAVAQIAANPAYRKLLKPKTAAIAGGAALAGGGGAFGVHRAVSKRLRIFKPVMGMKPATQGITNTAVDTGSLSQAFSGMAGRARAAKGQEAMSRAMTGATARRTVVKPTNEAAAAGQQAVNNARGAVRGRASRRRTDAIIAGTAGTAALGSAGVVGYDLHNRRKDRVTHL